jgi:hypothetical protein
MRLLKKVSVMCLDQGPNIGLSGPGRAHDPTQAGLGTHRRMAVGAHGRDGRLPPLLKTPDILRPLAGHPGQGEIIKGRKINMELLR